MSDFYGDQQNQNYGWDEYNMGDDGFDQQPQDMGFQSFDYGGGGGGSGATSAPLGVAPDPYLQPSPGVYSGSVLTPDPIQPFQGSPANEFEEEPPLLEGRDRLTPRSTVALPNANRPDPTSSSKEKDVPTGVCGGRRTLLGTIRRTDNLTA